MSYSIRFETRARTAGINLKTQTGHTPSVIQEIQLPVPLQCSLEARGKSDTEKKDQIGAGATKYIPEVGELHGEHIVHHAKELAGSPGSVRRELP